MNKDQNNQQENPPPTFWEKCKYFFYYPIRLFCYTRNRKYQYNEIIL